MGYSYLSDKNWSDVTRDERTFCAELFFEIRKDVKSFIEWLNNETKLSFDKKELDAEWEVGYEVCFYRDVRKLQNKKIKKSGFSQKRTFDLCLFSEHRMIIIEAKAQKGFDKDQNKQFMEDKIKVPKLLGFSNDELLVEVIALASSTYYKNMEAKGGVHSVFTAKFSWLDLYNNYSNNPVFKQADKSYKN